MLFAEKIDSLEISSTFFLRMPGELRDIECESGKEAVFENPTMYLLSRTTAKPPPPLREVARWENDVFRVACTNAPANVPCPRCCHEVVTEVKPEIGAVTWLACTLLIAFGCAFGCCIIPFFLSYTKNHRHKCPLCEKTIHIHRRF